MLNPQWIDHVASEIAKAIEEEFTGHVELSREWYALDNTVLQAIRAKWRKLAADTIKRYES